MIYGIGIDIVRVDRLREAAGRWGPRFLRRVFTDAELDYAYIKKDPFPSLSVRFAAKEAFIKAIGAEITVSLTDVEVVNEEGGRPLLRVSGDAEAFLREKAVMKTHVTVSHERDYGVACVVLEAE